MKLEKYNNLSLPEKFKSNEVYFSGLEGLGFYKYGDWSIIIGVDTSNIARRQHKAFAIHDEHGLFETSGSESHLNAIAELFRYDLIPLGLEFNEYFLPAYDFISENKTFIAIRMSDKEMISSLGEYKILENHFFKECCTTGPNGYTNFNHGLDYFLYTEQLLELQHLIVKIKDETGRVRDIRHRFYNGKTIEEICQIFQVEEEFVLKVLHYDIHSEVLNNFKLDILTRLIKIDRGG